MKLARNSIAPLIVLVGGLAAAFFFTMSFPAVEGLGDRVRLPVFHGAMTWVNLVGFSVWGVGAAAFLVARRPSLYRWVEALRWVAVGAWVTGAGLGLLAAFKTWDFTGSTASPISVAAADPRMVAQFWIVILGLALIALALIIEERPWLAGADVGFVAVAWAILLRAILGPGRALHPDSPVMNSEEAFIKLMFLGIFAGLFVAFAGAVWLIRQVRSVAYEAAPVSTPSRPAGQEA